MVGVDGGVGESDGLGLAVIVNAGINVKVGVEVNVDVGITVRVSLGICRAEMERVLFEKSACENVGESNHANKPARQSMIMSARGQYSGRLWINASLGMG